MGKLHQDIYGPPKGCYYTSVVAGSASLSVPTDFYGTSGTSTLYASNVLGATSKGVNIFGFTVSGIDGTDRTLTFYSVKSDFTTYDARPLVITIEADTAAGSYIPIGGPFGFFYNTDSTQGFTAGGGFAFITSNAALLGKLWWEPWGGS